MGKTFEFYRMALEKEIGRLEGFENALRREDREAFGQLMDMRRRFASESGCATNSVIFEPMVISILLDQQPRINELEKKLDARWKCNFEPEGTRG